MKLSDYVVRFVADHGVKHVFLVTGGGAMHLNASLAQCPDLEAVCNRTSRPAPSPPRITPRPPTISVSPWSPPGRAAPMPSPELAGAWLDSTPMLVISGQVKRPDRMFAADGTPLGMRQLGVQEVDIVSIVKADH